jgi:uncharacterized repeat protein (TIGR01451 family)
LLAVAAASCAALTAAASAHAVAVPRVDLAIVSKTANVTVAHPHQVIKFTIVATNNGPDVAQSLDVADLVDSRRNRSRPPNRRGAHGTRPTRAARPGRPRAAPRRSDSRTARCRR